MPRRLLQLQLPVHGPGDRTGGPLKWDLGRPYFNRHGADGYCHKADEQTHFCTIYDERPSVCRKYTCVTDSRIWKDFDAMIPNTEFLDAHLTKAARGPVEIFMDERAGQ